MTEKNPRPRFRFGEFVLDTARGVLLENDSEVDLRPQSFMVLQVLLENQGQVVSKEELHDRVWGSKAVTDDSLIQCLVDVRKALGDTDRSLIRTLPRRGYLFEGKVSIESTGTGEAKPGPSGRLIRRALIAAGLLLVVWVGWSNWTDSDSLPSIAVLRFDDLSSGQNLQFIGDGLAEDILNSLAHQPEISVIARTSSFAFSTGSNDIETIGDALNVDYVLEGSIREVREGEFRVVAQLIETGTSSHVWSAAFEIGVVDLAGVHESISREVWQQIAPTAEAAQASIVVPGFTADELMLVARHGERQLRDSTEVDLELLASVTQRYRDATQLNPASAKAHAGLARALLVSGNMEGAAVAVETAVGIDSNLSEVNEVLGRYRWLTGQPGAGEAWRKAVELNPNNADAIGSYGYWLWMQGHMAESEVYLVKARDLDVAALSRYADLGNLLGNEARIDDVHELVGEILQRFDTADGYRVVARLLDLIGQTDESIAWLVRARQQDADNPVYNWALAELFVDIGDYETAERLDPGPAPGLLLKMARYQEFIDVAEDRLFDDPDDLVLRYLLAFAYNTIGEHRLAIWQLDRARVLEFVWPEVRQMWDMEAANAWADAMYADGRGQEAEEYLNYMMYEFPHTQSVNWWRHFYDACFHSLLGLDGRALDIVENISASPRLPFLYLVRDARCLQKFRGNARFEAVIEHIEARQREFRDQLPVTLAQFGVELPELVAGDINQ